MTPSVYDPELLNNEFIPWDNLAGEPEYDAAPKQDKLTTFENWSSYARDYTQKRIADAPEDAKPELIEASKEFEDYLSKKSDFLKNKHDLGYRISKLKTSEEVISALRDTDKLRQEGFSDEVIFGLRKSAEKEFAPILVNARAGTESENEASKLLWEEPGLTDTVANFANRVLPVFATAALKTVEGVGNLAEIFPKQSDVYGTGFDTQLPFKEMAELAKKGSEFINTQFPSDPRLSSDALAATEGLAQVPFNLATAAIGTVPNAVANYSQMYQENLDAYTPQITKRRYEEEIKSGATSKSTPFKQWESLLSKSDKEDIRAEAATKAMLFAVPQAAIETVADKFLLNNVPLPAPVKSKLMSWRNARPTTYIGARVAANFLGKTGVEAGTEVVQQGIGNVGAAMNTGSLDSLTEGFRESAISGAFGGAGATALTLPNIFRTERAIDWAQSVTNGLDEAAQRDIAIIKDPNADINSPEYKAAIERASKKERSDYEQQFDLAFINDPNVDKGSVEFRSAEKRIQAREDEANWVLDRVGDQRADKQRAARYAALSDTRKNFENAFAKHIRENEPEWVAPDKELQARAQEIKTAFDNVRKGASAVGSNLDVDAAQKLAMEQLAASVSEKTKTAEKLITDFIGSVDTDGPGRALFARQEMARLYPNAPFSAWWNDDATVVELLNARENGEIDDDTNPDEWLSSPAGSKAVASESDTAPKTPTKPGGLLTTGERRDAIFNAKQSVKKSADPQLQEDFDKLESDLDFWHTTLANKDSSEEDKAEARALLPKLEDALLELATAPVEAKGLNQLAANDQNQTSNKASVPSQEVPPTSAAGQGTGAGEPFTVVRTFDGEEKIQTERDYINESRGIVTALSGTNEAGITMTPDQALQNVEAVRQEIEAAPDLTPEQKTQWASHFRNIPALVEQQRAQQTTPNASTAPAAASGVSESTGSPELIAGEGTISESPTPVRMNSVPGDALRTESGEVVFRSTADNTETVLRVKEDSIDKDPTALTVEDFEGGDGTPLISEANKQFSVLPSNDRPVRPFFRSEPQSTITPQDGQTAKSTGSYPVDAGSTPAPATPAIDTAAITAGVQANPDIHRLKDGNRKLVSREAAVAILTQLPETFTNKDVAALAKDSGMTSPNLRKLAALRGDQNAVASILNGGMDAELGLFDDAILKMRQERAATKAPLNETTQPTSEVSNDTAAKPPAGAAPKEAVTAGQSPADRWVYNAMGAIEEAISSLKGAKYAQIRAGLNSDEGRADLQRKLAGIFNIKVQKTLKASGILDSVVLESTTEKILYGAVNQNTRVGVTKNVLGDLLSNLKQTGDPFKVASGAAYDASGRVRNQVETAFENQSKRDRKLESESMDGDGNLANPKSETPTTVAMDGTTDTAPERAAKKAEAQNKRNQTLQDSVSEVVQSLSEETGASIYDTTLVIANLLQEQYGLEIADPVALGWKSPDSEGRVSQKLLRKLAPRSIEIFSKLKTALEKNLEATMRQSKAEGLLDSPAVSMNLASIIEANIYDSLVSEDKFKSTIAKAREQNSTSPLMPLLAKIDRSEVVAAVYSVLNNGKPFASSRDITALTQSDMQKVLDSGLLPSRIQETLQALVDLSGDGMAILQNSKNEGWRRWSELLREQMGNRAPVQVVFNLALDPAVTGQGLWQEGTNTVHVSPFLTREQGLMESTLLHEMMHPVWDWKVTAFQRGDLSQLNKKEVAALTELQDLLGLVKAEADKKLAGITDKAALEIAKRDLLGSTDLREFLNEAINHKPFQDFLAELKDPDAKAKGSLFRRIVNAILKLIRGGDVAEDSILQRSFELSLDLANYTDRELPIAERNKTQVEYFKKLEAQRGRKLTPEEAANAAADFAFKYPQPRIANTRAEASRLAPQVLTAPELDGFLASQAYEFVSPNDLEEALDLNGAIRELSSERQAQLRDFSNRVHEAFGMQGSMVTDAIGDWADGAEPTTVTEHSNPNLSYEEVKAMAALKGALRNQKAVIPFKVDGNGQQFLYDFFIPGQNIREARAIVAEAGIEFRTLIEQNGGTRVLVFDADGSVFDAFADLITKNKYEFQFNSGSGEFLGSWDSREEGKEVYTRTVEAEIARLGGQGRDLRPDSPEGIRIARLRNLAAEAGLTFGSVTEAETQQAPELAVVEALTGTAASQNEAAEILESAPNPTYYETLSNKGNDPITGSRTAIGRPANRRNRAGRNQPTDKERIPTRGADFPDEVRRGDRETHQRLERAWSGVNEAFGGVLPFQSVKLLDLLRGKMSAPEGSELAETVASLREAIPVLPNNVLEGLKQRAEGMTSKVFVDTKNNSAYKLVSVSDKGLVGGSFPKDISIRAADDTVVITSEKGPSLLDILRAVAISNVQGNAVFTEIAGVTEDGDVILKQPYIKGLTPTDNFEDPEGLREALRDLGLSMLSDIGGISAVGKVGDRYALFDDLHGENVMRDKNGRAQLIDALATRFLSSDEYASVAPYLKDPEVLASVSVPFKGKDGAEGKFVSQVLDKAVAEPAQSAFLKPEEFSKAREVLNRILSNPEKAKARGGRTINLNSPDDSTGSKLEKATGQRWDQRLLEARVIHALTEEDRTTPNANKIATAPMVPQTLQQADFVARRDFEGRPFLVFAKLYTDPDSSTGVRWHFVEAREDTGAFETQYSDTDPKRGRALAARVIGIGDSTPKKKKTLTGAGYAQGQAGGNIPAGSQGILPVPTDQGEVLDNTNVESVQNKILAEVDILTEKLNRLVASSDYTGAGKVQEQLDELTKQFDSFGVKQSAPVPFQGNVTPGFNPSVYTAADRRQTTAFTRVLNDPEYQGIRNALGGKQYISYTVDETLSKAEEFLNLPVHNGDLKTAFFAAGNATGITAEQVVMTKALAIQRAQKAANSARTSSGDMALPAATRNSMDTLARHYQDLADEFADDLMSQASMAGQELRAFRMLADSLSPYSWVRKYKQPIVHTQKLKMDADPVFKEMLERIKAARRDAANSTTTRMQKALAIAAKRFVKDTSVEEVGAYEKFARLLASNLSVREEVMQAATEMAVVSGMEAIRKAVAPGDKADPAFLKQWEDKLRSIASEQLNGIIESRLQGGMVDAEASPELTEEQKMAAREQKIMDAWRDFSDFPLAEMVFNLARSTIIASDSPYSALVRKAQFDPAKIKRLQQAVKMSINTAEEIRKSVADRNMSVESLVLRLQETNPSLSETEVGALAEAVKAVYDDEVQRASAAALQTIVNSSKRDPRKLTDAATISKILPLVNMGAFKEEEVYNALAEKFGLPTWSQENAEKIEVMANRVQALPEGSIERGETGQQMMLEILRANIKDSRGATRLQHMNQIASAVWTAGILSGPPTQIVNAAGTGLSVFLESFMDATGHFVEAKRRGVSTAQASEYYKDIARAWLFAFGKDANNTSLRAMNEVHTALTRGASKFKSEKQEDLSTLELFKFDPRVAIPGNAMMEAITTGEWKKALPQAGELGLGIVRTVSERVVNRDAKGALKDYLATLKMVGRGMLATDAMNSFAATAAKEMMIKRTLMQTEGLTDSEVNRQMKEIRKGGEESVVAAAKAQADQEAIEGSFGPAGSSEHNIGKARRVEQLIEQMTYGNSVMEQGRDFAANATFNSEAYGLIGATMMTVFGNMNRYAGVVAKPINPFPKTVSNLLNTSLNYTIYGYARAMGWNLGRLAIKEESKYFRAAPDRDSAEFYAAHAKATAGTLALGALAMMLAQALKDREEKKEPFFEVHGPGPKDPKLRAQWAQSGHKPFTVRIGSLELRYTDWPGINIPLGMLGTVYDNLTHTNKEADWVDQLFIGVASVLGTTLDRNMLGGATALFDLMSKNTYDGAKEAALGKLVSSYTGGFLKPSFVRYLETVATGGYQDARSMRGWFLSQIPVVGALANNPAINVLGEPIKVSAWDATAGRLVSLSDTHPVLSPLTTADLVIPKPEAYKIYDSSKPTMVRPMSAQEEYEYAAAYGKIMKERLTPELVKSLTEQAKFAPQGAQDVLTSIATGVRNQAQGELAAKRQIQKGKELKGP